MPNELPNRKSPRLPDYSYRTPGAYYITVCTHDSRCLFGDVEGAETILNGIGHIADSAWRSLRNRWAGVTIDDYHVVMPNHFHGIVIIGDVPRASRPPRLGDVVARFKASTISAIRDELREFDMVIWQERYYDHVVRDESDLNRIREYIQNNPAQWTEDEFYGLR